jgi:hypothetical protein
MPFLFWFITQTNVYAAKIIDFNHQDWRSIYDNMLTCRVVGYNNS